VAINLLSSRGKQFSQLENVFSRHEKLFSRRENKLGKQWHIKTD
jgi:hypothetical protein